MAKSFYTQIFSYSNGILRLGDGMAFSVDKHHDHTCANWKEGQEVFVIEGYALLLENKRLQSFAVLNTATKESVNCMVLN